MIKKFQKDDIDNLSEIQSRYDIQSRLNDCIQYDISQEQEPQNKLQKQRPIQNPTPSFYQKCKNYIIQTKNSYVLDYALILLGNGMKKQDTKNYQQALQYYQKVLQIRQNILGKQHIELSYVLQYMGDTYAGMCKYKQAISKFRQSLGIKIKNYGERHEECGRLLDKIAGGYKKMRLFGKALENYEKALKIKQQLSLVQMGSQKSLRIARSHCSIGGVLVQLKRFQQALEHFKIGLDICQQSNAQQSMQYATLTANLGNYYYYTHKYQEALKYDQKALELYEKLYKKDNAILTMNRLIVLKKNMGQIHRSLKDLEKSQEIFSECLNMCQQSNEYKNSQLEASLCYSLSNLYQDSNQLNKALLYCQRAVNIYDDGFQNMKFQSSTYLAASNQLTKLKKIVN